MKAAQFSRFGGPEVLKIMDVPDPHPGPGQVRVAVHAAGISGTDWKLRQGMLTFGAPLPQTTGGDVAGVVDEVGDGVTDVAIGDRVYGMADTGATAELALMTIRTVIPPSLGFIDAAGLPAALETATRALGQLAGQEQIAAGRRRGLARSLDRGRVVVEATELPRYYRHLGTGMVQDVLDLVVAVDRHRGHEHRAWQRRAAGRTESDHRQCLVRRTTVRHRGRLQDLRRVIPRSGAFSRGPARSARGCG